MFGRYPGGYRPYGGRGGGRGLPIMLLATLAEQVARLPVKPPVTLGLIALQLFIHYLSPFPSTRSVCLSASSILSYGLFSSYSLGRFLFSPLTHADDMHLLYNMLSFLTKGVQLERKHGSRRFGTMVCILAVFTHIAYLSICLLLAMIGMPAFGYQCAVGFSGVIFALKTVLNVDSPGYTNVGGMEIPSKHAAWAELLLIQLVTPNASFVGHLAGILAGLVFVCGERLRREGGSFSETLVGVVKSLLSSSYSSSSSSRTSSAARAEAGAREVANNVWTAVLKLWESHGPRTWGTGTWGEAGSGPPAPAAPAAPAGPPAAPAAPAAPAPHAPAATWACEKCTFRNPPGTTACGVCGAGARPLPKRFG